VKIEEFGKEYLKEVFENFKTSKQALEMLVDYMCWLGKAKHGDYIAGKKQK